MVENFSNVYYIDVESLSPETRWYRDDYFEQRMEKVGNPQCFDEV